MKAFEIRMFREKLSHDKTNLENRRTLHEHYEWLESYWQNKYKGNNHIDKFVEEFGEHYWEIPAIKEIARKFSFYPPVGSSKKDFEPTESILRATFCLRYFSDLHEEEFPDLDNEKETGEKWTKSSFNALLTILKQIRDNLFHGRKMELAPEQYNRNKELIALSVELTTLILDNLENAEKEIIIN